MKKNTTFLLLLIWSFTSSAQITGNFAPDHIIVKFKKGITPASLKQSGVVVTGIPAVDQLNKRYAASGLQQLFKGKALSDAVGRELNLPGIYIIKFNGTTDIQKAVEDYYNTGKFEYCEPDFVGSATGQRGENLIVPNDTYFNKQWGLRNDGTFTDSPSKNDADIDMELGWNITTGSSTVIVSTLDTGNKLDHPEYSGRIWVRSGEIAGNSVDDDGNGYIDDTRGGWNFVTDNNNPTDDHGHGTNVTGIIGANGNNSSGFAGVDWKCKLMICKVLDNTSSGFYTWWISALNYSVDNGARVINMSLGGTSASQALSDAVTYAFSSNVLVVAASGNSNNSSAFYPAFYANAFTVGSIDSDDERSVPFFWSSTSGSNYGSHLDVVAPGNYIYGLHYTSNTNYGTYWGGTSQAAPHVSGLAALLLAQSPSRTADSLRIIIKNTAQDKVGKVSEDVTGFDQYMGWGRVNAYTALTYDPTGMHTLPLSDLTIRTFPNPFSSEIIIRFALPFESDIRAEVLNPQGQLVKILSEEKVNGNVELKWDGSNQNGEKSGNGIYFLQIKTAFGLYTKKLIFLE